jgi:hypothetical protein
VSFRVAGYTNQNIFDDGVLLDYNLGFLISAALITMFQKLYLLPSSASNFTIRTDLIILSELLINISYIHWEIWLEFYSAVLHKTNRISCRNVTFSECPTLTKELTKSVSVLLTCYFYIL